MRRMDGMDELVAWIGEQLDDDERAALKPEAREWVHETTPDPSGPDHVLLIGDRVVSAGYFEDDPVRPAEAQHIALHDPARVLREVEAKRRILDAYEKALDRRRVFRDDVASAGALLQMVAVVKLLALPFAGRPGYRSEWAPADARDTRDVDPA